MSDKERLTNIIHNAQNKYLNLLKFESSILADYLLANGVIVPPCKVGDKVYSIIYQKKNVVSHILIEEYVGIHLSNAPDLRGHRRKNYIIVWNENTNSIRHIDINKIGKTVFLTKEEAEEKLRELNNNA